MFINDRVYGRQKIEEKVLIDLILSEPLQRLKRVNQAGISGYIIPYKKTLTRFEHSVGVMVLLKKFGSSLTEQIAGLVHDVSHTAFSHVADYVFPNEEHEFHEWHYKRFILHSEIATILKSHRFDPKRFLDQKKFTLLERPIPDLCADRIDYFLRDRNARLKRIGDKEQYLHHMAVQNQELIFTDPKAAYHFAKEYLYQNKVSWYNPREVFYYKQFADILKRALEINIITQKDFFTYDNVLWKKLHTSKDRQIKKNLDILFSKKLKFVFKKERDSIYLKSKPRYVVPKVLINKKLFRLLEVNKSFREHLKKEINWMQRGFWVKIKKI